MTVGIDVGISTTKAVALDGGNLRAFCAVPAVLGDPVASASGALGRLLRDQRRPLSAVRRLAVTGVGASAVGEELFGLACERVPEFQATGRGGLFLSGLDQAIVVGMGTGTSILRVGADGVRHLGGSGVGGGTLLGLSRALLRTTDVPLVIEAAAGGDLANVDLRIADLPPAELGNLPGHATASNFGRLDREPRPGDQALGILNLVFQTIGVLASFAARQEGLADIVLTGRLATIPQARDILAGFAGLYPVRFHFPENPTYATALGAALCI
jgi:type II pantothenate kinase